MRHPYQQRVIETLFPASLPSHMNVWAIVDGARDDRVYGAVDSCRLEKCCLYSGDLPWQLQMTAPYLVQLDKDESFTRYLVQEGWGNSWGIFLRSDAGMQHLRRHFRGFLRVRDEKGMRLLFRYYDPRVLRLYLPTCLPEELRTVFGPVARYMLESSDPAAMLEFTLEGSSLSQNQVSLRPAA